MEHPFSGSWGYQVIGYFRADRRASARREDFMYFIDRCHQDGHRRDHGLGAGALPEGRARAGAISTAPRSTSTPIRARASIATGAR